MFVWLTKAQFFQPTLYKFIVFGPKFIHIVGWEFKSGPYNSNVILPMVTPKNFLRVVMKKHELKKKKSNKKINSYIENNQKLKKLKKKT